MAPDYTDCLEAVRAIADDMGSMGEDVRWCETALATLMLGSARRGRTPRTVCTMAHFAMARRLGTGGVTANFIDEVSARIAAAYERLI